MDKLDFIQQQARAAQALEDEQIDEILSESALLEHIAANTDFRAMRTPRAQRHLTWAIAVAAAVALLVPTLNYGLSHQRGETSPMLSIRCFSLTSLQSRSTLETLQRSSHLGCKWDRINDAAVQPRWMACVLPTGEIGGIPTYKRRFDCTDLGLPRFHFSRHPVATSVLADRLLARSQGTMCVTRQRQVRQVAEILGKYGVADWRIQVVGQADCTAVRVDVRQKRVLISSRPSDWP
jgi:hypothetical protein